MKSLERAEMAAVVGTRGLASGLGDREAVARVSRLLDCLEAVLARGKVMILLLALHLDLDPHLNLDMYLSLHLPPRPAGGWRARSPGGGGRPGRPARRGEGQVGH